MRLIFAFSQDSRDLIAGTETINKRMKQKYFFVYFSVLLFITFLSTLWPKRKTSIFIE